MVIDAGRLDLSRKMKFENRFDDQQERSWMSLNQDKKCGSKAFHSCHLELWSVHLGWEILGRCATNTSAQSTVVQDLTLVQIRHELGIVNIISKMTYFDYNSMSWCTYDHFANQNLVLGEISDHGMAIKKDSIHYMYVVDRGLVRHVRLSTAHSPPHSSSAANDEV